MKKTPKKSAKSAAPLDLDFSLGERGRYASRYAAGTNVVLLAPDVAKAFPTTASVNKSLRALASILRSQQNALDAK